MAISNPYQQYKTQSVSTLAPGELIILLYDKLSLCLNNAVKDIRANHPDLAHDNIIKAENIVLYFIDILDINYPIADELLRLYDFLYRQMVRANIEKNAGLLEEVLKMSDSLKETWKQADLQSRQKSKEIKN